MQNRRQIMQLLHITETKLRLEWIEDLLAVMDNGSLSRAAQKRLLTQPAFSRRIRSIEDYVGVELLDRSRKPVQLKKSILDQRQKMQDLASGLRQLVMELNRHDRDAQNRIVIASQHAITTSVAPNLIKKAVDGSNLSIRLRSANRDECHVLLMTHQADLMLIYQSESDPLPTGDHFLEQCCLGSETLVPVFSTKHLHQLNTSYAAGEIPVIVYPSDVFLGRLLDQDILPKIPGASFIRKKAETALTLAGLQLALTGIGVAWIPKSLAKAQLGEHILTDLSDILPSAALMIWAIRLNIAKSEVEERFWQTVKSIAVSADHPAP